MIFRHLLNMRSHPTWVRGLKLQSHHKLNRPRRSHPTWVRGLKLCPLLVLSEYVSRTLRGCVD